MKRALLLAGMLFMLMPFIAKSQTSGEPLAIQTTSVLDIITSSSAAIPKMPARSSEVFRVATRWCDETVVDCVYARRFYENDYYDGVTLTDDVVIRFYSDASGTVPTSVSSLTVYYRIIGFDGTNMYDYNNSAVANGDHIVVAYSNEHDYADGVTQRYRDYHLLDGAGYIAQ